MFDNLFYILDDVVGLEFALNFRRLNCFIIYLFTFSSCSLIILKFILHFNCQNLVLVLGSLITLAFTLHFEEFNYFIVFFFFFYVL